MEKRAGVPTKSCRSEDKTPPQQTLTSSADVPGDINYRPLSKEMLSLIWKPYVYF